MPSKWSKKDERMYTKIKQSNEERGISEDRSKEIAARTVNKKRRQESRTANKTTQGTGNPRKRLEERTVTELRNLAKSKEIKGRSHMKKAELVTAIRQAG